MADVQLTFGASLEPLIKGVEGARSAIESMRDSTDRVTEGAKSLLEAFGLAFSVEKIGENIDRMAELGVQTERSMATLGLSSEQVGTLSGIAKLTGGTMEGLSTSIERMSLNIQK